MVEKIDDERVAKATVRIIKARNDMQKIITGKQHRCSHEKCAPMDEQTLINAGQLQGPPLTSNVYVCQLGSVHICSASTCEYSDKTCHISGIQHATSVSNYVKDQPQTWYDLPVKKVKKAPKTEAVAPVLKKMQSLSDEQVRSHAGDIVKLLLFGTERINRNNAEINERKIRADKMCEKYRKEMLVQRQLPYESVMYCIRGSIMQEPLPLCEFVFSDKLYQYYIDVIVQEWKIIITYLKEDKSPVTIQKCDIETISVSTLYCMKRGFTHEGATLLPFDAFLKNNLPAINDLSSYFNVDRKRIQRGRSLISAALIHSLRFKGHASLNAVALTSITKEQEELYRRAKIFSKVPVELSTNGETLFMPQSRMKK